MRQAERVRVAWCSRREPPRHGLRRLQQPTLIRRSRATFSHREKGRLGVTDATNALAAFIIIRAPSHEAAAR